MPTYQYRCADCGHQLEVVQSFSDAALTQCPECAGTLRKLFSAVGVVFKGSGFYRTDSTAKANGKRSGTTSDSAAGKDSGGEKSSAASNGSSGSGSSDSSSSSSTSSSSKTSATTTS